MLEINKLHHGDCAVLMKQLPDNYVDTIITDPPYGLSFMGKKWDYDVPSIEIWKDCLRVLKPGGTALIFAGSRTQHRMAVNVEDAGFVLKDCIMWLYSTGFPKATDISKQLDMKLGGNVKIGKGFKYAGEYGNRDLPDPTPQGEAREEMRHNPTTPEAKLWDGWKSHGLKPAYEPILVAMKPNEGSYAENALKHGVSGLNMDGGRIGLKGEKNPTGSAKRVYVKNKYDANAGYGENKKTPDKGRFPSNIILDEEAAKMLDKQSGESKSIKSQRGEVTNNNIYQGFNLKSTERGHNDLGGASRFFYTAKASKDERNRGLNNSFINIEFSIISCDNKCQEKSLTKEERLVLLQLDMDILQLKVIKDSGIKENYEWNTTPFGKNIMEKFQKDFVSTIKTEISWIIESKILNWLMQLLIKEYMVVVEKSQGYGGNHVESVGKSRILIISINEKLALALGVKNVVSRTQLKIKLNEEKQSNIHCTVKPIKLMEYLCTLTKTPSGGLILDPFAGSGSTLIAAYNTSRDFIGFEISEEYFDIAKVRIKKYMQQTKILDFFNN